MLCWRPDVDTEDNIKEGNKLEYKTSSVNFGLGIIMAAADQIKSLIKSFGEGDEDRFYATAMQITAAEARNGHVA